MRTVLVACSLLLVSCSDGPDRLPADAAVEFEASADTLEGAAEEASSDDLIVDVLASSSAETDTLADDSLTGYGGVSGRYDYGYTGPADDAEYAEPKLFNEDAALSDARREAYRRGYRGFCTDDCSGHEAGFNWAHENRLRRPQPTFDSPSFDEGQEAYFKEVERRVEEKRQEFEMDPDSSAYSDE